MKSRNEIDPGKSLRLRLNANSCLTILPLQPSPVQGLQASDKGHQREFASRSPGAGRTNAMPGTETARLPQNHQRPVSAPRTTTPHRPQSVIASNGTTASPTKSLKPEVRIYSVPAAQWTVKDVGQWAAAVGLEDHRHRFLVAGITGSQLLQMTPEFVQVPTFQCTLFDSWQCDFDASGTQE